MKAQLLAQQQEVERHAVLAAAQLNKQNIDAPCHIPNDNNENLGYEKLDDAVGGKHVGNMAQANQNQQQRGRGHQ